MKKVDLKPMTHERIVGMLDYHFKVQSKRGGTKAGAVAELEGINCPLADLVQQMSEESGAACYFAARIMQECYGLIIRQQAVSKPDVRLMLEMDQLREEIDRKIKESTVPAMSNKKQGEEVSP